MMRIVVQIFFHMINILHAEETNADGEQIILNIKKLKPLEEIFLPAGYKITIPHIQGVSDVYINGSFEFFEKFPCIERPFYEPMEKTDANSWVYHDKNTTLGWGDRVIYVLIFSTLDGSIYNSTDFHLVVVKSDDRLVPMSFETDRIHRLCKKQN